MAGHSYEKSKRLVYKGLALLAIITLIEVAVSLFGKGHIVSFEHGQTPALVIWIAGLLIIGLSLYKAVYIIYEFMHMGHEVPAFRTTVLLPTALLIWAVIAFIWEGDYWKDARSYVLLKSEAANEKSIRPIGGVDQSTLIMPAVDDHHDHSHDDHGDHH